MSEAAVLRIDPSVVRWSVHEHERAGRPLLLLLHGYGSHEDDLFGLAPFLPHDPVIASLRAPIAEVGGHAWFSHARFGDDGPTIENADAAAHAVLAWLDEQAAAPSVGLLGFSQGGAMVLQLLRTDPARFAYGVQLSGYVVAGPSPGDAELARIRPPVFWGRGSADTVIEQSAGARTAAWLPDHASAEIRVYDGVAHEISPEELVDVAAFIRAQL